MVSADNGNGNETCTLNNLIGKSVLCCKEMF